MRQALALAQGVLYLPSPNPRVGCVIIRDGAVIGRGATQLVGGPHAEVMALRDVVSNRQSTIACEDVAGLADEEDESSEDPATRAEGAWQVSRARSTCLGAAVRAD